MLQLLGLLPSILANRSSLTISSSIWKVIMYDHVENIHCVIQNWSKFIWLWTKAADGKVWRSQCLFLLSNDHYISIRTLAPHNCFTSLYSTLADFQFYISSRRTPEWFVIWSILFVEKKKRPQILFPKLCAASLSFPTATNKFAKTSKQTTLNDCRDVYRVLANISCYGSKA